MKKAILGLVALAVAASFAASAQAQKKKLDFGKHEYDSNCAVCHGLKGKGDGPYAGMGSQAIADLTQLAAKNGGTYPFQRVYEVIDGSQILRGHGTSEMPIWGQRYRAQAGEAYFDVPYDPEAYVRTRILSLTEYVARLQSR